MKRMCKHNVDMKRKGLGDVTIICGEAFDKVIKMIDLGLGCLL